GGKENPPAPVLDSNTSPTADRGALMKGHWRTERRLRRERAEIPADLLDSLVRRTHSTAPRTTGVRIRFGAAAAVMAVASVTAAVFGGYSYAASAASKTST